MTTDLQLDKNVKHVTTNLLVGELMGLNTTGGPVRLIEARRFVDMAIVVFEEVARLRDVARAAATPETAGQLPPSSLEGLRCGRPEPEEELRKLLEKQPFEGPVAVPRRLAHDLMDRIEQLGLDVDNAYGDIQDLT